MTRVAVIGLGGMGSRIAGRFLDAGHDVLVWNRTAERAAPLVEAGAKRVEAPADAAREAEVVITMVADANALRSVVEGPDGVAGGIGGSTALIEMSTVGPAAVRDVRAALPDAVGMLDAPVLGSLSEVEAGSLRIFVGGPSELAQRWLPLLSVLGTPIHVGPLGAGASAKLVANSTLVGTIGVLGEALALAEGLGLSRDTAFEVLSVTPSGPQAERRREAVKSGEYPRRFGLSLARKDADLIADAASAEGLDLRLAAAGRSWLTDAEKAGHGDEDYSAVLAYILTSGRPTEQSSTD